MQGPTHFLTGILIEEYLSKKIDSKPQRNFMIISSGLFSHGLLDRLAKITYHPANARWNDPFWLSYHIFIYGLSLYILFRYGRHYWLGIISASFPDFDWVILRPLHYLGITFVNNQDLSLHQIVYSFLDALPVLKTLKKLPDFTLKRPTIVFELFLLIILANLLQKSHTSSSLSQSENRYH